MTKTIAPRPLLLAMLAMATAIVIAIAIAAVPGVLCSGQRRGAGASAGAPVGHSGGGRRRHRRSPPFLEPRRRRQPVPRGLDQYERLQAGAAGRRALAGTLRLREHQKQPHRLHHQAADARRGVRLHRGQRACRRQPRVAAAVGLFDAGRRAAMARLSHRNANDNAGADANAGPNPNPGARRRRRARRRN